MERGANRTGQIGIFPLPPPNKVSKKKIQSMDESNKSQQQQENLRIKRERKKEKEREKEKKRDSNC